MNNDTVALEKLLDEIEAGNYESYTLTPLEAREIEPRKARERKPLPKQQALPLD